jgi:tripartite-type tricarboxylate transporter receptor subunit TctC
LDVVSYGGKEEWSTVDNRVFTMGGAFVKPKWKIGNTAFLFGFFVIFFSSLCSAQQYPGRPLNLLINFVPGGTVDVASRILATKSEKFLGQPFIISNNGGGGGSVGLGVITKERPDGYHLLGCTSTGMTIIPHLRAVPYTLEDFSPILNYAAMRSGLAIRADSPWKSFKELVDYARSNPGKVTYGTAGVGTTVHLAMEYVGKEERIQWTHIPYPGSAPAIAALLGGHISAVSTDTTWMPHVKAGTLRLLATYEENRMKAFPDVPTLRELGYDYTSVTLYLMAAPKGIPAPVIKKLEDVFRKGMEEPEFIETMSRLELEVTYRNSVEAKKTLEDTYLRFQRIIRELKIPTESEKK